MRHYDDDIEEACAVDAECFRRPERNHWWINLPWIAILLIIAGMAAG